MGQHSMLHKIAWILLLIGGLNWLIFGLFQTDIGTWLGGMDTMTAKIIYILVGLSAVYLLIKKMSAKSDMGGGMMNK